jgi:hypothetical protein
MPDTLEPRVRAALARRAATVPPTADPPRDRPGDRAAQHAGDRVGELAGAALRRAGRLRARHRRRVALATAAAVLAVIVGAVGTAAALGRHPAHRPVTPATATPAPAPSTGPAGVDLLVGNAIRPAGGGRVPLPPQVAGLNGIWSGWRVSGGWLFFGTGPYNLNLVSGTGKLLWRSAGAVDAISPDGTVLVWLDGTGLRYGRIGPDGVTGATSIRLPPGAKEHQTEVSGLWHGKVVLRYPAFDGDQQGALALWDPAHPGTVPASTGVEALSVVGPSADGRHLLVLTSRSGSAEGPFCLAEVDPDRGFAPAARGATECPAGLLRIVDESPGHRWAGATQGTFGTAHDRWYDLSTFFDGTPGVTSAPGCPASNPGSSALAWESADTYLTSPVTAGLSNATPAAVTRCRVGNPTPSTVHDPRLPGPATGTRVVLVANPGDAQW